MKLLQQEAYEHLKNMIANEELSYDTIYSETKMAQTIGVSRTPFRDAIQRLMQEGYIDIIPSKGFRLHKLTEQDVTETFEIRCAIETFCTIRLCQNHTDDTARDLIAKLEQNLNSLQKLCGDISRIDEFSSNDYLFHESIVKYSKNRIFIDLFQTYMYRIVKLAKLSLSHPGRMEETCHEHNTILEAIKSGNTASVLTATYAHMINPRTINLEDLKQIY